jgi:hypothetical protein
VLKDILNAARAIFQAQLAYGRQHRIREPGFSVAKAGRDFAAFYAVEYGTGVSDGEAEKAWGEVETALRTLYEMDELKRLLREGSTRIAQRPLTFPHSDASVLAVPDLIVFSEEKPPAIVDWKVHTFGVRDYKDQLVTYAIALIRTKPHRDFPSLNGRWKETDIGLLEVQLLRRVVRPHTVEEADIQAADDRIAEGITAIQLATGDRDVSDLRPDDFLTANDPKTCETCSFRKICWS